RPAQPWWSDWSRRIATACSRSCGRSARPLPDHEAALVQRVVHPDHLAIPREHPRAEGLVCWLGVIRLVGLLAFELGEQEILEAARAFADVPPQPKPGEPGDGLRPPPDLVEHVGFLVGRQLPGELEQHHVLSALAHAGPPSYSGWKDPKSSRCSQ